MSNITSLEAGDNASKAVQKTPNRVSLESIQSKVQWVDYINPPRVPHMTIAVVGMENGFILTGKTAPADPDNFNEGLGKKFAYEDAIRQAWQLEGYLLREDLHRAEQINQQNQTDDLPDDAA